MRRLVVAAILGLPFLAPTNAHARLCEHLPMRCTYEAPAFSITVVDAETRQPLSEVHGLAEWQEWGLHGRGGPLMVLDAISRPDGILRFDRWGPLSGPNSGVLSPNDPVVTLFKPGYRPLIVFNNKGFTHQIEPTERIRPFGQDGQTFELVPFRGTPPEWLQELRKVDAPQATPISDEDLRRFRGPYLNRLQRIVTELNRLPDDVRSMSRLQLIEAYIRAAERRHPQ